MCIHTYVYTYIIYHPIFTHIYMYVYIYICIHVYNIQIYSYVCIYIYVYICIYACIYMYIYIYIYMFVYVCMGLRVMRRIYIYIYIVYVYLITCVYVYVCVCVRVNLSHFIQVKHTVSFFFCIHTYIHVWMYTYVYNISGMGGLWLVGSIKFKIIGLFCKRALQKRRYSTTETCNSIDPTDRSHPSRDAFPFQILVESESSCTRRVWVDWHASRPSRLTLVESETSLDTKKIGCILNCKWWSETSSNLRPKNNESWYIVMYAIEYHDSLLFLRRATALG